MDGEGRDTAAEAIHGAVRSDGFAAAISAEVVECSTVTFVVLAPDGALQVQTVDSRACLDEGNTPYQETLWAAVRHEVGALSGVRFAAVGKQRLKGLAEELELFELRSDDVQVGERIRDPVCGIEMAPTEVGAKLAVKDEELAFCCAKCLRVFLDAPQRYRS